MEGVSSSELYRSTRNGMLYQAFLGITSLLGTLVLFALNKDTVAYTFAIITGICQLALPFTSKNGKPLGISNLEKIQP
ncbi:hypothetical protein H8356DRAFT_1328686 [Neocallimastix lanati (nom. inval.)]|nr:hypothetical protein H8356DRAFT_1328686 [Neocallimastix sp. JGI-2020a]